ncbi:MAG: DUF4835 family protein [Balneolaceae bacterium]
MNCTVTINDRQISSSASEDIRNLGPQIERYINERRWSGDRFREHERINCRFQIILNNVDSQFNYSAEVIIDAQRPIYDTMQQSSILLINDNNWRFNYTRNKSLIFDELQFDDLTSFIDFYVYIILGFDYDTFSELGGTSFFNNARSVMELAQNSSSPGWSRSIGSQRNRFGLINDLSNPLYEQLRRAIYRYHRLGLDQFTQNTNVARTQILDALKIIRDNKERTSSNYLFDIFFDTKFVEITSVFLDSEIQQRMEALNVLTSADPGHSTEYQKLQN